MTPRRMRPIPAPGGGVDVLVTPADRPELRADHPELRAELNMLKALDIAEFNSRAEAAFVALITDLVKDGDQSVRSVLVEAAYELDISIETAKRYLLKHSARRAEFDVTGGRVRLRR